VSRDALIRVGAATAAVVAIAVAVVLFLSLRHHGPATIPPVPHATTPAREAQNLENWLRRYSR
jgi:hypothetical protein